MKPRRAYGMTECPTVSAPRRRRRPRDPSRSPTAASSPASTCASSTRTAPTWRPGTVGEFLVRGPQRALGYLDAAAHRATASTPTAGSAAATSASSTPRLHHGDRPHEGHHQPRRREALRPGDRGVAAPSPRVAAAAVVAAPHPRLGEEPAAFMIRRPAALGRPTTTSASSSSAEGVAPQKIPRIFVAVDDLPRTASGKVKKYELVEQLPPRPDVRRTQVAVGPAVGEVGVALLAEGGDALVDVVAQVQQSAEHGP